MSDLLVRDLMTESVITLNEDEDLGLAEEIMKLGRVRHLPVIDANDRLVGLITHRDLLRAQVSSIAGLTADEDKAIKRSLRASQIMNTGVQTVAPTDKALTAAQTMQHEKIGCLPVVDAGKLVGIVTEADFLGLVIRALSSNEGEGPRAVVGEA